MGLYSIPLVTQDVSDSDLPSLLFNSLRKLDQVSTDLAQRLQTRTNEERNKIRDIRRRTRIAKAKVDQLPSFKEAIKVYSSSKYPMTDTAGNRKNQTVLPHSQKAYQEGKDERGKEHELLMMPALTSTSQEDTASYARQTKKAFSLWMRLRREQEANWKDKDLEGVGKVPQDVRSCTSMLLFNTGKNPYSEYMETTDNLVHGTQSRRVLDAQEGKESSLADAPASLVHGSDDPDVAPLQFAYKPAVRDVEFFELPSDLMLPNVVDITGEGENFDDDAEARNLIPSEFRAQLPEVPTIEDYIPASSRSQSTPTSPQATHPPSSSAGATTNASPLTPQNNEPPPPPRNEPPPPPRNEPPPPRNEPPPPVTQSQPATSPSQMQTPQTNQSGNSNQPRSMQQSEQSGSPAPQSSAASSQQHEEAGGGGSQASPRKVDESPPRPSFLDDIKKMDVTKLGKTKKATTPPLQPKKKELSQEEEIAAKFEERMKRIRGAVSGAPKQEDEKPPRTLTHAKTAPAGGGMMGGIAAKAQQFKEEDESDDDSDSDD
eukprot:gb/GECG01002136.1/.p1 GENE.gb/GECG01002136.1/~~gb/GECG01002136.1/.p1  ORF type:complete len:544 (+),score=104.71 gb/GECG01002136.1/:1-1632(+)